MTREWCEKYGDHGTVSVPTGATRCSPTSGSLINSLTSGKRKLTVGQRADEGESMGDARMLGRCRDGRRAASLDWGGGSGGERGAPRRGVLRRRPPWQRTRWRRRLSVLRKRDYYTKTIQRLSTICTKELYEDNNIHWRLRWLSLDLSGSGCWAPAQHLTFGGRYRPRQQSQQSRRRAPFSSSAAPANL